MVEARRRVLFIGHPGTGKTIRAREFARECTHHCDARRNADIDYAWRVAGLQGRWTEAPFRAPHYTVSAAGMTGRLDGHRWRPGEISLAHGGVLFLDEAPRFALGVLEMVQSAFLYARIVHRSAAPSREYGPVGEHNVLVVPTYFSLVLAADPCPCGYRGHPTRSCSCTDREVERYFEPLRVFGSSLERVVLEAEPSRPPAPIDRESEWDVAGREEPKP